MKEEQATLLGFAVVAGVIVLGFTWMNKRADDINTSIKNLPTALTNKVLGR